MTSLFEARKHEDCETRTTQLMGAWLEKLTDRMVTHIKAAMETRRHPNGYDEPDYERILREREGGEFRMGDYHEGGDKKSWKDYLLGIMALIIMAWLTRISIQMDNVIRVVVRQEVDEKQIAELRCTVYKICQ